jgi:acyl-ACP thioesterase
MHVNNALYPLWASETLDNSFRDENLPSEIEISFKKEGYLGDDIEVISEVSEGKTIHSIKAINDNRELSSVRINWIKR